MTVISRTLNHGAGKDSRTNSGVEATLQLIR